MKRVRLFKALVVEALDGEGVPPDDPVRTVYYVYTEQCELLGRIDLWKVARQQEEAPDAAREAMLKALRNLGDAGLSFGQVASERQGSHEADSC